MRKAYKTNSVIRRFITTILLLVLTVMLVTACGQQTTDGKGKLKITATTGMITDVVQQVGGEYVEASGLMGAGIDPHLYKASQGDVKKLDDADVIFYNGLHLEGKMAEMFEALEKRKPTVAVSSLLEGRAAACRSSGRLKAAHDPHIWFNVKLWISAAEVIRDTLAEKDSAHAAYYKERAAAYIKELEKLDNYAREQIALIPEEEPNSSNGA